MGMGENEMEGVVPSVAGEIKTEKSSFGLYVSRLKYVIFKSGL